MLSTRKFRFEVKKNRAKDGKKYHTINSHKRAGMATLTSDKGDFKTKKCYQRLRGILNNDKRVNPSGKDNYKHVCT